MADWGPPQIDFSALSNLYDNYKKGQAYGREDNLRKEFSGGLPRGPNGEIDFNAAVSILGKYDPVAAVKLQAQTQDGGASVYGTPIYGEENGQTVLGAIGKDGSFRKLDTGGVRPTPGLQFLNQGTQFTPVDRRTGAIAGAPMPIDVQGKANQAEMGQQQGAATIQLPKVEYFANSMIRDIDKLSTDPRLGNVTGVEANFPTLNPANVDVEEKIKQLGGGTFLQAFEGLKGGGQITNIEGEKATVAINRLQNMRQSDPGYKAALSDAKTAIWELQNVARAKAGQPPLPAPWGGGATQQAGPAMMQGAPANPQSQGPQPLPPKEQLQPGQVYNLPSGQQGLWTGEGFEVLN